jgi:hypothetical protein
MIVRDCLLVCLLIHDYLISMYEVPMPFSIASSLVLQQAPSPLPTFCLCGSSRSISPVGPVLTSDLYRLLRSGLDTASTN